MRIPRAIIAFALLLWGCRFACAEPVILKASTTLTADHRTEGNGVYLANKNIVLDLNGHTIYFGSDNSAKRRGVVLYISWSDTEIVIPGAATPTGCVIKNGRIVHEGTGANSAGVYGFRSSGVRLENVEVVVNGNDSAAVYFGVNAATLVNNVLVSTSQGSANRHSGPACVRATGAITATGNVLIGGNSGFNVGNGSVINRNVIAHNSHVTNGYGAWLYRLKNVQVIDNLILPVQGRGILWNAGEGHLTKGNVILHRDLPNKEFGDKLNATAIRSRYDVTNCVYEENTSLGIGGGAYCGASGLYLTNAPPKPGNRFSRNDLTTLLVGDYDKEHYAQGITLEGQGPDSTDEISANTFRSNHLFVRLEGYDGYGSMSAPLVGNRFELATAAESVERFIATAEAKLASLNLDERCQAAARKILDERWADLRTLPTSATIAPKFWLLKYYGFQGDYAVKATLLDSVFGPGVNPASWARENGPTAGAIDVWVKEGDRNVLSITKSQGADAPVVVTEFGPPKPPAVRKRLRVVEGEWKPGAEVVVEELE